MRAAQTHLLPIYTTAPALAAQPSSTPAHPALRTPLLVVGRLVTLLLVLLTLQAVTHRIAAGPLVSAPAAAPPVARHIFHTTDAGDALALLADRVKGVDAGELREPSEEELVVQEAERLLHLIRQQQLSAESPQPSAPHTNAVDGADQAVSALQAERVVEQRRAEAEVRSLDDAALQSLRWPAEASKVRPQPTEPMQHKRGSGSLKRSALTRRG